MGLVAGISHQSHQCNPGCVQLYHIFRLHTTHKRHYPPDYRHLPLLRQRRLQIDQIKLIGARFVAPVILFLVLRNVQYYH